MDTIRHRPEEEKVDARQISNAPNLIDRSPPSPSMALKHMLEFIGRPGVLS
jgi:hypothetical protein